MQEQKENEKARQAERLKYSRIIRQLSQEEFSESIGMSPSGYQKVERGQNGISRNMLRKIWEEFRISADFILFGEQEKLDEIIRAVDQCSDEEKMVIFLYLHQYWILKHFR
ncbi:MAG: helix-turn-helix domain-containing protein [Eubacterium sp.]|nr:helix-turn-helix domain-containing protein [Eubacterium sp.]